MTTFSTQLNGEPCYCRVFHYQPASSIVITGSGYGDCEEGDAEEFEFALLNEDHKVDVKLMKAVKPSDVVRLIEEFLFEQEYEYRRPYQ